MRGFRTYAEMDEIYKKLSHLPGKGHPYCITLHKPDRYFGFIGTSHSTDPNHHQWKNFFNEWDIFLSTENSNKIVFHEGRSTVPVADSTSEAIQKGADNGLTVWLAQKHSIDYLSPEPNRAEEVNKLKDKGYSEDELITYYVGRQVIQWLRRDKNETPDLNIYIEKTLSGLKLANFGKQYFVDDARKLIEQAVSSSDLETVTFDQLNKINNPSISPIARDCNIIRDESIFKSIESELRSGKDIFCVYGSGHAIVLEPALKELIDGV